MNAWTLSFDTYNPDEEGLREALCTVGNGYLATRGAAAESTADETHYPGTYLAGVYNRLTTPVAGVVVDNESLVNLPNWLPVTFRIDGGPWFDIDAVSVLEYHQCLDLQRAVLTRRVRFRDAEDRVTSVVQHRFVHMGSAHVCALEMTVTADNWSGRLDIRSALDGRVANRLVRRYRDLSSQHVDLVQTRELPPDGVLLEVETNQSRIPVVMAARSTLRRGLDPLEPSRRPVGEPGWVGHELSIPMDAGESATLDKVVTVYTGRDRGMSEASYAAARQLSQLGRFPDLLDEHTLAWSRLWRRFQIEFDGNEEVHRILRLHLVHLLQTVSPHTQDLDVGVPARGLHGEAYRGHIFWDEVFIFPVLTLRTPALTRSLLGYRYRRLPEARRAAREARLRGAMYPWQSGSDGREENQQRRLNPRSGRWLPDPTWRERHVGIAVGYNVWQYYQATGDRDFLLQQGAEMLMEIARFWSSLITFDPNRARYVIRGVMGPDEFHAGYPDAIYDGIDNNAYTNVMAAWVMLRALDAIALLPDQRLRDLMDTTGVDADELSRWRDISYGMFVPFHGDGIISQFEGYDELAELDWDGYRRRYGNIQRLDWILEAEGDSVNRYQATKQADVLMLLYLMSAEELTGLLGRLGYQIDDATITRTIDYYLARSSHGSSLSAVVHVWVLARARHKDAMEFFETALRVDITDIQGGTTSEGIHLAAMAGSVDLMQRCFVGLETRSDRLILNPYWPESFGAMEFAIQYREQSLLLRITGSDLEVTSAVDKCPPITIDCRGEMVELHPGSTVRFSLHPAAGGGAAGDGSRCQ